MCNVRVCKVMVWVCKVMRWVCKVMVQVWKVMVRVCKVMVQPWMAVSVRGCRGAAVPTSVPLLPVDRSVCVGGGIPVGFPVPRGGPHSAGVVVGMGGALRASQSCTPPSRPRRTPAPQRALRGGNGPSPPLPPTSLPTGSSPGPAAAPSPLCFPPHPPRHPVPVLTSERGEEAEDAEQRHGGGPLPPPVPVPVPLPRRCPRCCPRSPRCWSRRRRRRRRPGRGGPGREAVPCAVPGPPRAAPLRRRQRRRQRGRGRSAPAPPPPGAPGWGAGGGGHREPGRVREPGSSRCPPQPPPLCAGSVPAGPGGERGPAALRSGPDPREGPARTGGTDLRDPQTGTPQAPPPHLAPPPNP